jgi:hypothetical protein
MRNEFHQAIPKLQVGHHILWMLLMARLLQIILSRSPNQAARELEPDFPTTYFMLGIAFQSINELGQAKQVKRALRLSQQLSQTSQ